MLKSIGLVLVLLPMPSICGELTYNFNSAAFSGIGYSAHVLTINQLETQATEKNKAAAEALQAKAEAAALNTPEARFAANLESRIYSQLAQQLTNSMFSEGNSCTVPGAVCGTMPDLGGNSVTWSLGEGADQGMIIITIVNNSNPSQTSIMKVPSGTFYF
jgi:hypothetical protein